MWTLREALDCSSSSTGFMDGKTNPVWDAAPPSRRLWWAGAVLTIALVASDRLGRRVIQQRRPRIAAFFALCPYTSRVMLLLRLSFVRPSAFSSFLICAFWQQRLDAVCRVFRGLLRHPGAPWNRAEPISPGLNGPFQLLTPR